MKRWFPILGASLAGLVLGSLVEFRAGAALGSEEPKPAADPVVYWELACHDAEKSVAFFEEVFGWEIAQRPGSTLYHVESKGEDYGINGGIFTMTRPKLPWLTVYIHVDDIEAKAKEVEEKGGLVVVTPQEFIPGAKENWLSDIGTSQAQPGYLFCCQTPPTLGAASNTRKSRVPRS